VGRVGSETSHQNLFFVIIYLVMREGRQRQKKRTRRTRKGSAVVIEPFRCQMAKHRHKTDVEEMLAVARLSCVRQERQSDSPQRQNLNSVTTRESVSERTTWRCAINPKTCEERGEELSGDKRRLWSQKRRRLTVECNGHSILKNH
jgi:hypothetical protein